MAGILREPAPRRKAAARHRVSTARRRGKCPLAAAAARRLSWLVSLAYNTPDLARAVAPAADLQLNFDLHLNPDWRSPQES